MQWPDDADGDVFRRLQSGGFDFSALYTIDFNVDFENWPPPPEAISLLQSKYGEIEVVQSDDAESDEHGFLMLQIQARLTYEWIIETQAQISQLVEKYGGWCNSWGVMH